MDELKQCAHCGSDAELKCEQKEEYYTKTFSVQCTGTDCYMHTAFSSNESTVKYIWNRRFQEPFDTIDIAPICEPQKYEKDKVDILREVISSHDCRINYIYERIEKLESRLSAQLVTGISAGEMFEKFNYPKLNDRIDKLEKNYQDKAVAIQDNRNSIAAIWESIYKLEKVSPFHERNVMPLQKKECQHDFVNDLMHWEMHCKLCGFKMPMGDISKPMLRNTSDD